jgi:hypothetical protein
MCSWRKEAFQRFRGRSLPDSVPAAIRPLWSSRKVWLVGALDFWALNFFEAVALPKLDAAKETAITVIKTRETPSWELGNNHVICRPNAASGRRSDR